MKKNTYEIKYTYKSKKLRVIMYSNSMITVLRRFRSYWKTEIENYEIISCTKLIE